MGCKIICFFGLMLVASFGVSWSEEVSDEQVCRDAVLAWVLRADKYAVVKAYMVGTSTFHANSFESIDLESDPPKVRGRYPKTDQIFLMKNYMLDDDTKGNKQTTELICNASRDYRIEECSHWTDDFKTTQTKFAYGDAESPIDDSLVSFECKYRHFGTQKIAITLALKVDLRGAPTGSQSDSEFRIEPAVGSWVEDLKAHKRFLYQSEVPE